MPDFDLERIPYLGKNGRMLLSAAGWTKASDYADKKAHDLFTEYIKSQGEPNKYDRQILMTALRIAIQYANAMDESRKAAITSLMSMPFVDERMANILYEGGFTSAAEFKVGSEVNINTLSFEMYEKIMSRAEISPEECPRVWMTLLAAYGLMDPAGDGGSGKGPP